MKNLIRLSLIAVLFAAFSTTLNAQNKKQRMSREQFAEVQAQRIAEEIGLDDATSKKFVDTYRKYQEEVWALGPRQKHKQGQMTDEETEKAIKDRFAHSQKILDIRQKYYNIYSDFLSQKQIQRVYELEKQTMNRLAGPRGKRGDRKARR